MSLVTQSFQYVDSDYTSNFRLATVALVGSQYADLRMAGSSAVAGGNVKCFIETVRFLSLQNLDWRLDFYQNSIANGLHAATASVNAIGLLGGINFYSSTTNIPSNVSYQITQVATGFATLFVYLANNLHIPYEDRDGQGQLHLNLVTVGAAKNAGDSGLVHVRVGTVQAS